MSGMLPPKVQIFADLEDLSRNAADFFCSLFQKTVLQQDRFVAALSGGSTPRRLYELLGSSRYRKTIDWKRVHIFLVDERCVPRNHPDSNYGMIFNLLLAPANIPESNIHRIAGEDKAEQAARRYEQELRSLFSAVGTPSFDLIILGVGEDGHTASLFPNTDAVFDQERLTAPVYLEPPKPSRVTLTFPVLNHAAQILLLASGQSKAEVVHEIIEKGNPRHYPAGLLRPAEGSILWFLDRAAAGLLKENV